MAVPPPLPSSAAPPGPPPVISTYLIPAIVLTLCTPLGGLALFFALKAERQRAKENWPGAVASARWAKIWCWVALISASVLWLAYNWLIDQILK